MRRVFFLLVALAALSTCSIEVMALPTMSIPFASFDGVSYLMPWIDTGFLVVEYNASRLALSDNEKFGLSFHPEKSFSGEELTLAPIMAQTSDRELAYERVYYFADTSFF